MLSFCYPLKFIHNIKVSVYEFVIGFMGNVLKSQKEPNRNKSKKKKMDDDVVCK